MSYLGFILVVLGLVGAYINATQLHTSSSILKETKSENPRDYLKLKAEMEPILEHNKTLLTFSLILIAVGIYMFWR